MKKNEDAFAAFMYHEVSDNRASRNKKNKFTPLYNLSTEKFESHLEIISQLKFNPILADCTILNTPMLTRNTVCLTFDDGYIGNYENAFPLLNKYNLKATFFVTVSLIEKKGYMNWSQLRELNKAGMSIQSHSYNHVHLSQLNKSKLIYELQKSKNVLEEKLSGSVSAISFPHGSYNRKVIECSREVGYQLVCTSDIGYNTTSTIESKPAIIKRIAIISSLKDIKYKRFIQTVKKEILRERIVKESKNLLKKIIGIRNYGILYRKYFNIEE